MKKITLFIFSVALLSAVIVTSCWEVALPEKPASEKTVVITGTQLYPLISGEAGTTTFAVSTTNIDVSATGTVQWYDDVDAIPIGAGQLSFVLVSAAVSTGDVARTLTVSIGADSAPGIYYFRITIDGVASNVGVLIIGERAVTVVNPQEDVLVSGEAGATTFTVSTTNIDASATGTVQWYADADGIIPIDAGQLSFVLVATSVSTGDAIRTLTVSIGADSAPGIYYFCITIDGVASNVGVLIIGERAVTVVNPQKDALVSGEAGTTTFTVSTTNINVSATGTVQWYADADGIIPIDDGQLSFVLVAASVSTGNAIRTLTVSIGPDSAAGTYWFRVYIDDVASNVGMLQIN